jgi:hypothetical protein
MPQIPDHAPLLMIAVERPSDVPMHRQVFDQIRDAILGGRLAPGRWLMNYPSRETPFSLPMTSYLPKGTRKGKPVPAPGYRVSCPKMFWLPEAWPGNIWRKGMRRSPPCRIKDVS